MIDQIRIRNIQVLENFIIWELALDTYNPQLLFTLGFGECS